MTIDDVCQIAKTLEKLTSKNFTIVERKFQEAMANRPTHLDTEEPLTLVGKDKRWDKYPLLLLLEWENKLRNSKEPATKKALAKLLMESSEEVEKDHHNHELLKTAATSLIQYAHAVG